LLQAGGPLEGGTRADISRRGSAQSVPLATGDFLKATVALEADDKVFIRQNPASERQRTVELLGEVRYPGRYVLDNPETKVSEIIAKAGGLKPGAFPEGAILLRALSALGGSKTERIVFQDDAILQDGDQLTIPLFENTVRIEGAVKNPIAVTWQKGKSVKDYLEMAGGLTADADESGIQVIAPNGAGIKETGGILFWRGSKIPPGTRIVVSQIRELGAVPER
jgi:protein involved in polysaccharide export with SLBB domain